jgi:uncharacterized membrane protein
VRRVAAALVAALALATVAGIALLWPGDVQTQLAEGLTVEREKAEVERVEERLCAGFTEQRCQFVTFRLQSGPDRGRHGRIQLGAGGVEPDVDPADEIYVTKTPRAPAGQPAVTGPGYSLSDFERRDWMLVLAAIFVLAVLLLARLRGALSVAGLAFSLAVVVVFVVPAILDGEPPLAVAVVGAMAIALITIPLAHGGGPKSIAALLGTAASLMLTAALAALFTKLAHLTGLAGEEAALLQLGQTDLSLEGLLLAGMVIAALGVLDDVTVSQASTVLALRDVNPGLGFSGLFGRALRVGRDHVSATVNTLVLAYVGAALPVLLLFSAADLGVGEVLNLELVAQEVVATLVGSIGLIAAVPLTTALAARLALDEDPEQVEGSGSHIH